MLPIVYCLFLFVNSVKDLFGQRVFLVLSYHKRRLQNFHFVANYIDGKIETCVKITVVFYAWILIAQEDPEPG